MYSVQVYLPRNLSKMSRTAGSGWGQVTFERSLAALCAEKGRDRSVPEDLICISSPVHHRLASCLSVTGPQTRSPARSRQKSAGR